MTKDKAGALRLSVMILLASTSTSAFAQVSTSGSALPPATSTDTTQSADDSGQIADIIVTAQKRSELAQDVPIALSVFDAKAIAASGARELEQIARATPGLQFTSYTATRPQIFLRGIGSGQIQSGVDGSVGVFIDEVYVPRQSAIQTGFFDVERIEVLKGPQGTLYGRNTIGGAINITTAPPAGTFEGRAEVGIGSFKGFQANATASGPLSETVSARLTAGYSRNDGYMQNLVTGKRGHGDDTIDVAGKLLIEPSDRFSIYLIAAYNRGNLPGEYVRSAGDSPLQSLQPRPGVDPGVPANFPVPIATINPDPYSERYSLDSFTNRRVTRLSGRLRWSNDDIQISSVTSYFRSTLDELHDSDGTALDIWSQRVLEDSKTFAQELRLQSVNESGPQAGSIEWMIGGFFFRENVGRNDVLTFGRDTYFNLALTAAFGGNPGPLSEDYRIDIRATSLAGFAQVKWHVSDNLSLTAGGRYTNDRKRADITLTATPAFSFVTPPYSLRDLGDSWSAFDPKLTLAFEPTTDINIYASVGRGFKSGGFQTLAPAPSVARQVFAPERVTSYEAGLKSKLFDNRVRLNLSGYYTDYSNLQVQTIAIVPELGVPAAVTNNAASSRIYGAEAEMDVALSARTTIGLRYAYTNAQYEKFLIALLNRDYSGQRMPRSPEHVITGLFDTSVPLGSLGSLGLHADATYTSTLLLEPRSRPGPFAAPGFKVRDYVIGNARIEYRLPDDRWRVALVVRNVFDVAYQSASLNLGDGGATIVSYGAPRTWGLSVLRTF
jgi:iron complex outermembrane recepter protein